jgi:hypothetical protein
MMKVNLHVSAPSGHDNEANQHYKVRTLRNVVPGYKLSMLTIPVTGRGDPQGCGTSRRHIFYIIGSQMAVRSTLRTGRPLPPRKIPGTHFCLRLRRPQGHDASGRIRSIEESNDVGNRTRDLPACSIVPQPPTLPRAP